MADTSSSSATLYASCQCGHVRLPLPGPKPLSVGYCHCTNCRQQSGGAFGSSAYFPVKPGFYPLSPDLEAQMSVWTRPTDRGGTMYCYFCPRCGSHLMHAVIMADGSIRPIVSVKTGCIEDPGGNVLDWKNARHIFTRSAVFPLEDKWETYKTFPQPKE